MLTYIRNFILSKNFYLILFTFWTIKQFFYFYDTLDIYKNVSLIFIIVFSAILFLAVLSIFNILNKKEFFQYFSIIFFLLIISNFFYDVSKDYIKQKRQEIFIKEILKEKNKYHSFDFRTQKAVVEDLRKENNNKNIYQAILPNFFFKEPKFFTELLPLSGISNATTVLCNESGEYSIYQSDRYGFNNPDINYDNNTKERVMLIGDSFVHGACVDQEDTLSSQLNKVNIPSFSISYGGNGPLLELATLIEYIHVLKPKIVIWFYCNNDLTDLFHEKKSEILVKYLQENNFKQKLSQRQNEIDVYWKEVLSKDFDLDDDVNYIKNTNLLKKYLKKIERAFLLKPIRDILKNYYKRELENFYLERNENNLELFKKIIYKAKTISEENDSLFYFVYLPFLENIQNPSKSSNIKNEITKIIKDLDVEFIDFQDYVLYEINKPETLFPIINHGHYNSKGYKALSGFLLKSLGTF